MVACTVTALELRSKRLRTKVTETSLDTLIGMIWGVFYNTAVFDLQPLKRLRLSSSKEVRSAEPQYLLSQALRFLSVLFSLF